MIPWPDITCQTEINLRIERGQLDSAPLRNQFGMTPSREKERPDLIRTVTSLAVRIIYNVCCVGYLSNVYHEGQSEAVIFHSHHS